MIDPLRFDTEVAPPFSVNRPVFCTVCQYNKHMKANPNVAIIYCAECPKRYLCKGCDELAHDLSLAKNHVRRILVVGPGVRKKVLTRGDKVNYPLPLDRRTFSIRHKLFH